MMITFHKSITIVFLVASLFITGVGGDVVGAQESKLNTRIKLKAKERAWLAAPSRLNGLIATRTISIKSFRHCWERFSL